MLKEAKVLVAGGAGFIGSNLALRLANEGFDVFATRHTRPLQISDPRITYVEADLTRMGDCHRVVEGMDYVFMCAANTSGAAVIASTPLVHVTSNIVMNSQILEAAYNANVRKFVWISSNTVYPPTGDRPVKEDEMLDGEPYETYFGVAWMKRYTEILCKLYSQKLKKTMPTVVLRPSNIFGPYDDFDFATSHVTAALVRKVAERHNPIEVWGTGQDVRDIIYIDDFVDALMLAFEKTDTYDPINIAFGKGYTLMEILALLLEVDGYQNARVQCVPTGASMIPVRLIDTSKAEDVLGFRPKTSLKEGLRKTIQWYRESRGIPRVALAR